MDRFLAVEDEEVEVANDGERRWAWRKSSGARFGAGLLLLVPVLVGVEEEEDEGNKDCKGDVESGHVLMTV